MYVAKVASGVACTERIQAIAVSTLANLIGDCHANVNIKDSNGETVLVRAINANHVHVVERLLTLSSEHDLSATRADNRTMQELLKDKHDLIAKITRFVPSSWWKKRQLEL